MREGGTTCPLGRMRGRCTENDRKRVRKRLYLVGLMASQGQVSGHARGGPMVLGYSTFIDFRDVKSNKTGKYKIPY